MYHSIAEFLSEWKEESGNTIKVLDALSDASLSQPVRLGDRTLGRIAWHIAASIPEMMSRAGLQFTQASAHTPVPHKAAEMTEAYRTAARELATLVQARWTDETLKIEDDMYGMQWPRGLTLQILMRHEIHHRGQMTVLMRQAGLRVPGVYGPSREEWAQLGMAPPEI